MKLFFNTLAMIVGLLGLLCLGGSVFAAIAWIVQKPGSILEAVAVLSVLFLVILTGLISIGAAVRFFRDPSQARAKEAAGLFCFWIWLLYPRGFTAPHPEERALPPELFPLAASVLIALLIYRLVLVPMILRAYPPPDPEPGSNAGGEG